MKCAGNLNCRHSIRVCINIIYIICYKLEWYILRISILAFLRVICVYDIYRLPYRDENHGEYEVLAEKRHYQRSRRYDLDDQQEEHVETDENRNGKRHLRKEEKGEYEIFMHCIYM